MQRLPFSKRKTRVIFERLRDRRKRNKWLCKSGFVSELEKMRSIAANH